MISKGNHVKFARFVLLAVSEEAKTWLPGLLCWLSKTNIARHRKNGWRQGLTNTKRSTKVAKELFADYVKEKKLREPEEKKELAQTLKTYILCRSEKGRIRSMYNKTIITFGFYDIQNTQGESVRVISRGRRLRLITPVPRVILDITKTSSNNCLLTSKGRQNVPLFLLEPLWGVW